jgi:hypothetical protein
MNIELAGDLGPEEFEPGSRFRWLALREMLEDCKMDVWYRVEVPLVDMTRCHTALREWGKRGFVTINLPKPVVRGEEAEIRFRIVPRGDGLHVSRSAYRQPKEEW